MITVKTYERIWLERILFGALIVALAIIFGVGLADVLSWVLSHIDATWK